jgi:hypothetical protein
VHYFIFFCLFLLQHNHFKITQKEKKKKQSYLSPLSADVPHPLSLWLKIKDHKKPSLLPVLLTLSLTTANGQRPPLPLTVSLTPSLVPLSHRRNRSATGEERICDLG